MTKLGLNLTKMVRMFNYIMWIFINIEYLLWHRIQAVKRSHLELYPVVPYWRNVGYGLEIYIPISASKLLKDFFIILWLICLKLYCLSILLYWLQFEICINFSICFCFNLILSGTIGFNYWKLCKNAVPSKSLICSSTRAVP